MSKLTGVTALSTETKTAILNDIIGEEGWSLQETPDGGWKVVEGDWSHPTHRTPHEALNAVVTACLEVGPTND